MNTTISSVTPQNITSMSRLCALGATIGGKTYAAWLPNDASLLIPLRWRNPRHVELRSDLFHENVTDAMLDRIFAVMALCPQHTFQVLTKRPERMHEYWLQCPSERRRRQLDWIHSTPAVEQSYQCVTARWNEATGEDFDLGIIAKNVWLGVSVEDQKTADARIPLLLQTPAAVRFISYEPALGPINLTKVDWVEEMKRSYGQIASRSTGELAVTMNSLLRSVSDSKWEEGRAWRNVLTGAWFDGWDGDDEPELVHARLDWVICGGESGPGARPMHPDWARSVRDQCVAAGVPFFFKQNGEWAPGEIVEKTKGRVDTATWFDGEWSFGSEDLRNAEGHGDDEPNVYRIGKKLAGRMLDGAVWQQFPEVRA